MKRLPLILIATVLTTGLFLSGCIEITTRAPAPDSALDSTQPPASSQEPTTTPTPAPDQTLNPDPSLSPDPALTPAPDTDTPTPPLPGPVVIPPLNPVPTPCPSGTPPAEIKYFSRPVRGWRWKPSVTISSKRGDYRIEEAYTAIRFWNQHFADMGTRFRLGPVYETNRIVPVDYLTKCMESVGSGSERPPTPEVVEKMEGGIIISLSNADIISFSSRPGSDPCLIGIRRCDKHPLNLPNVSLNIIAHELGHVIGLGHNNDPTTLMCGRPSDGSPATCNPESYKCDEEKIFRITKKEKSFLREHYPPTWRSSR